VDAAAWQQAKQLIEEALSRPAADRRAFLDSACRDPDLRREVETMLETYDQQPQIDQQQPQSAQSIESSNAELPTNAASHNAPSSPRDQFEFARGFEIGPYVLIEPLGRGGGGEVHRARDTRLQRDVAIKVLAPRSAAEGVRRVREARAAAQLNHRGIGAVYDVIDLGGRPCIVMEHVPGLNLAERLERGRLDLTEAIDIGMQIADAAAHAHASGIVHCDLKPANVKFAADGSVKVLDFGLARRSAGFPPRGGSSAVSGLTAASLEGLAIGTPGYMSPEQLLGLQIDVRTDVYSIGVMLFEMAVGERPFGGADVLSTAVAVLSAPLPELPRRVPRRLRAVVQKSLNRAPDDRYASAAEFAEALDQASTAPEVVGDDTRPMAAVGPCDATRAIPAASPASTAVGRRVRASLLGGIAALALVGAGFAAATHASGSSSGPPTKPSATTQTLPVELRAPFDNLERAVGK
jgi:hypothetical protein